MRDVIFLDEAEKDIRSILRHISLDAPNAALNFVERIRTFCSNLSTFPVRGDDRSDLRPRLRTLAFEGRASIAFIIESDTVIIIAVIYKGRDVLPILGKRVGTMPSS